MMFVTIPPETPGGAGSEIDARLDVLLLAAAPEGVHSAGQAARC